MEVIFGRDFKLEAADPYLFYAYEFRRFTLGTRLIVSIGYGFGDGHINKMLAQALKCDAERRLFVIARCADLKAIQNMQTKIVQWLQVNQDQVVVHGGSAKEYLEMPNLKDDLHSLIPKRGDAPF